VIAANEIANVLQV